MMSSIFSIVLILGFLLGARSAAGAAETAPHPPVLRVGVVAEPPFVMRDAAGQWQGLGYELWTNMMQALGQDCEYRLCAGRDEVIAGLRQGTLEAAIGRFVPDADLERETDLTHAYFFSGLGAAMAGGDRRSHWQLVYRALVNSHFPLVLLALFGAMILAGLLIWLAERRRNPRQFGGTRLEGIGSGIWCSAATMKTVGYGDKTPITPAGRLLTMLWMFSALVLITSYTATITSLITTNRLQPQVSGPDDLRDLRVAVIDGSSALLFLNTLDVTPRAYGTVTNAMAALEDDSVDVLVHDAPVLQYYARAEGGRRVRVMKNRLQREGYVFLVPDGSPVRSRLNAVILDLVCRPAWRSMTLRYLGE